MLDFRDSRAAGKNCLFDNVRLRRVDRISDESGNGTMTNQTNVEEDKEDIKRKADAN